MAIRSKNVQPKKAKRHPEDARYRSAFTLFQSVKRRASPRVGRSIARSQSKQQDAQLSPIKSSAHSGKLLATKR